MRSLLLAQDAPAQDAATTAAESTPWWQTVLDNGLFFTILFIFLAAIVGLVLNQRRRDKCLKLFHDFHISYQDTAGKTVWGDLIVFPKGLEVVFDAPYRTLRGILKTSVLIYEEEKANMLAISRCIDALTPDEVERRRKQIDRSFHPNAWRRFFRWCRNLLNTLKDAFAKALSAIIGAVSKAPGAKVLATQQGSVDQIGQTLLGAAGNAYEAILEHHIGKPVVVQLHCPAAGENVRIDLPGYLADYTEHYLAIFNTEHDPIDEQTHTLASDPIECPGYTISPADNRVRVTATGPEVIVVKWISNGEDRAILDTALLRGSSLQLLRHGQTTRVHIQRTRRVDLVCARAQAKVVFGGEIAENRNRPVGRAPEPDVEAASDKPVDPQPAEQKPSQE